MKLDCQIVVGRIFCWNWKTRGRVKKMKSIKTQDRNQEEGSKISNIEHSSSDAPTADAVHE